MRLFPTTKDKNPMSEDRLRILNMLANGKITAEEAERLIAALETSGAPPRSDRAGPKYLRVQVWKDDEDRAREPRTVNIRVPLQLLRAGVKLPGLLPPKARDKLAEAMSRKGVGFDPAQLKAENLEAFIATLSDVAIDIDADDGKSKVKVSCE